MSYHKGYPDGRWKYFGIEGFEQGPRIWDRIYEDYELGEIPGWFADAGYAVIGWFRRLAAWTYTIPNNIQYR